MKSKQPYKVPTGFRFSVDLVARLRKESDRTGLSKTRIIEFALQRYLHLKRR